MAFVNITIKNNLKKYLYHYKYPYISKANRRNKIYTFPKSKDNFHNNNKLIIAGAPEVLN